METKFIPYEAANSCPGSRIGVIAPHPDDEVFGPGGSLAIWSQNVISVAVVSDGMGWGQQENLEQIRQEESKAACRVLSLPEPEFWRHPDGHLLERQDALRSQIQQWIEQHQLDCVFIPSIWEMHRDHRACAEAGLLAALNAKCLESVWQYEIGRPLERVNRLVDISEVFEQKQTAMRCYPSQFEMQNYFEQITALNIYRTYTLPKSCKAAEGFYALNVEHIAEFLRFHQPQRLTQEMFATEQRPQTLLQTLKQWLCPAKI